MQLGGLGERYTLKVGSEAEPQPKSNMVHFSPKIISGGNNFDDFPEKQLRAV